VVWDLFGLDQAAGALRVTSDQKVVVGARVFNLPGDDIAESQGQFIAGLPVELALAAGKSTDIPGITQPADGSFRSNFGLVETTGNGATVLVTLFDGQGIEKASREYVLGGFEAIQKNLSHLNGPSDVNGGRLNLQVVDGSGRALGFASLVASGLESQDPSTLEMETDLEVSSPNGGITEVNAGAGLVGGGAGPTVSLAVTGSNGIDVSDDAVGIADSGVRGSMIADGVVVRELSVDGRVLHDQVALVGGPGVILAAGDDSITVGIDIGFDQFDLDVDTTDGAWTTVRAVGMP